MKEKINNYLIYKWVLATIFVGNDYVVKASEQNEQFKNQFYSYDTLLTLFDILKYEKPFDKEKLNNVKSAMQYYINNHKDEKDEMMNLAQDILALASKKVNEKSFYKYDYALRTGRRCKFLTSDKKKYIDKRIVDDIFYLSGMINKIDSFELQTNDVEFLKSIKLFKYECPELVYEEEIFSYIYEVLEENQKYEQDSELQKLNQELLEHLNEIDENGLALSELHLEHSMFSILFTDNINEKIKYLRQNSSYFFTEETYEVLYKIIKDNKSTCAFEQNQIDNAREMIFAFYKENVITNEQLNEMKIELNIVYDKDYKDKNQKFYYLMFKKYGIRDIENKYGNYENAKNFVQDLIVNTGNVFGDFLNLNKREEELGEDIMISYYLNYFMNSYSLINENPIYLKRVERIAKLNLEYNFNEKEKVKKR